MTPDEWLDFHQTKCGEMYDITKKKNSDYTGKSVDPFENFRMVERLGIASVEVGFLTRMTDKMARLAGFTKTDSLQVKDESVTDTLLDLANYCLLMAGYLESEKQSRDISLREYYADAYTESVTSEPEIPNF